MDRGRLAVGTATPTPYVGALTDTSATIVFTARSGREYAETYKLVNKSASPVTAIVEYYDGAAQISLFDASVPANGFIRDDIGFRMKRDDTIRITAGTGGSVLHYVVTIVEPITSPAQ